MSARPETAVRVTTAAGAERTTREMTRRAWLDRDLSWLEFNRRVLSEALDERNPLLERVKFLAIFSSNLDEFFMKRMAVIRPSSEDTSVVAEERRDICPRGGKRSPRCSRSRRLATPMSSCRSLPSTGSTCWIGRISPTSSAQRHRECSTPDLARADAAQPRRVASVSVRVEPLDLVGVSPRRPRQS